MAAGLIDRLNQKDMSLTTAGAEALIADRVTAIALALHISERSARAYMDQDALDGIAQAILDNIAAEAPGSDLLQLARTAALPIHRFGRLVAALGTCNEFLVAYADIDEELRRDRIQEVAQLITCAGLMQSKYETGDDIYAPPAMFARVERMLTNVADLTTNEDLSLALRSDALLAQAGATQTDGRRPMH